MALDHTLLPILPSIQDRLIGNSILVLVTALVVALRIVARLVTGSKLGWDDYLILATMPQGMGLLVCQGLCKSMRHPMGFVVELHTIPMTVTAVR